MTPTTKTLIFGAFLFFGGLIAKNVYANGHGSCHGKKEMYHRQAIKAISKDVDLTAEQKEMWLDFKEEMLQDKKAHKEHGKSFHPKHSIHKNIHALIADQTDAQTLHKKIDEAAPQILSHIEQKQEKMISILDILETYNQDQREQALNNLDILDAQREAQLEENEDIFVEKLDQIFDGVAISENAWNDLKNIHQTGIEEREIAKQRMIAYLDGSMTKESVISEIENTSSQTIERLHQLVNIWDGILKDISKKDRQKILQNWNVVKQEHISSCAPEKTSPKQKHRK